MGLFLYIIYYDLSLAITINDINIATSICIINFGLGLLLLYIRGSISYVDCGVNKKLPPPIHLTTKNEKDEGRSIVCREIDVGEDY